MALKATIFKAELQVSDLGRHYYARHALTVARHPSETDERMMVRLLAFALHADEALEFTRGLSTDDEPELWRHAADGSVGLWIELGLPESRRLRRACGRADEVVVVAYGGHAAELWWGRVADDLARFGNLTVVNVPEAASRALAARVRRNMQLTCTVDGATAWIDDGEVSVEVELQRWK
jgi:uncharacterized protein YaeQ